MIADLQSPLTSQEIETICSGTNPDAKVKIFCINGVVVEVLFRKAIERLPFDVMMMQKDMAFVISSLGVETHFLSPMTSDMLIHDLGGIEVININKNAVNMVAAMKGANPVFSDEEDGILRIT